VDISITKVKTEQSCWLQTGNAESELVPDLQLSSIHARADRKAQWSSEPQPPTQQPPEEASVLFNKLSQRQKTGSHFFAQSSLSSPSSPIAVPEIQVASRNLCTLFSDLHLLRAILTTTTRCFHEPPDLRGQCPPALPRLALLRCRVSRGGPSPPTRHRRRLRALFPRCVVAYCLKIETQLDLRAIGC